MEIIESSITLDFPDENYFRLCDCNGYKVLQNNLKEMDVCWFDKTENVLYLIELKNWDNNNLIEENDSFRSAEEIREIKKRISEYRIGNLLKKSVDSTCMFMSILLNTINGKKILECSPFKISEKTDIRLLSIINWNDEDLTYISTINTAYRSKFNSYARLFNIKSFHVLTKTQAAKIYSWVS